MIRPLLLAGLLGAPALDLTPALAGEAVRAGLPLRVHLPPPPGLVALRGPATGHYCEPKRKGRTRADDLRFAGALTGRLWAQKHRARFENPRLAVRARAYFLATIPF